MATHTKWVVTTGSNCGTCAWSCKWEHVRIPESLQALVSITTKNKNFTRTHNSSSHNNSSNANWWAYSPYRPTLIMIKWACQVKSYSHWSHLSITSMLGLLPLSLAISWDKIWWVFGNNSACLSNIRKVLYTNSSIWCQGHPCKRLQLWKWLCIVSSAHINC